MKRAVYVLALLAPVALVAAPAVAMHNPGHQPGNLTLRTSKDIVVFGKSVRLSGKLTGANNSNKRIALRADEFPFGAFSTIGTTNTDANGDYSFLHKPEANTRYRARRGLQQSSIETVRVRIRAGLRVSDRTPSRGQRVRFRGRAYPEHDGSLVRIQRRTPNNKWRTVRRARLQDAGDEFSTWSKILRPRRSGRFRALVARDDRHHAAGISPVRLLRVQ